MNLLKKWIPFLEWLPEYDRRDLGGDFSAGVIVAVMLIPQGMAYAMLAGLPPVIGLYSATIPLLVYALFGSSRQLAVGPVAMVSLLVFTGVSELAEPGTPEYVSYVLLLSLMIGVIQLAMGVLRLGVLVNFLSHAVVSGFTSAAAIIIGLSQLKHLLGVDLKSQENVFLLLMDAFRKMSGTHPITLLIGLTGMVLLVLFKRWKPRFPAPLLVVGLSTLVVYLFGLDARGVKIVGEVPQGIPAFSLPGFNLESAGVLLPIALTISFVGFMESIAVAKAIAAREKYKVDSDQELRALGLANIFGSFFSAYPVTGGFSRSAVNYQSGARTGLASILTALLIIVTLLFLTPLFYYLPQAVLAAIVMVAVFGLIDVKEAVHLFKVKKADGWVLLVTFITTLTLGVERGILLGVAFSLLLFIIRSARPHTAELGYLADQDVYRNTLRYLEAKTDPEVLIFRVDASLYFANMSFLEDRIRKGVNQKPDLKWIIFDFSGVNDVDAVALDTLQELVDNYRNAGIEFLIAGMKGPVRDLARRAGWLEKYGDRIGYFSVNQAIEALRRKGEAAVEK